MVQLTNPFIYILSNMLHILCKAKNKNRVHSRFEFTIICMKILPHNKVAIQRLLLQDWAFKLKGKSKIYSNTLSGSNVKVILEFHEIDG